MNMQQRKYVVKNRIVPMQKDIAGAVRQHSYRFKKYTSWGELIDMIQAGELKLKRKFWHKSCHSSNMGSTYDNPFEDPGGKALGVSGGVDVDSELLGQTEALWKQRFTHAMDFIWLASEDTGIKLLHDLERQVKEFCEEAGRAYTKANEEAITYREWLRKEGEDHDYR